MQQLAKYLKMKETALDQLVKDGTVPFIKTKNNTVIFKKSDIDKWMEDKKKKVKEMIEGQEVL
jgi:excisionase family DNA binding protein